MPDPRDLTRRAWDSETASLATNLTRELDAAAAKIATAREALAAGKVDTHSLRLLATAATEARQYGGALAQAQKWRFVLDDDADGPNPQPLTRPDWRYPMNDTDWITEGGPVAIERRSGDRLDREGALAALVEIDEAVRAARQDITGEGA